jgi:hypothetical protein
MHGLSITEVSENLLDAAIDLLCRFFQEEGFAGDSEMTATNFDALRRDPHHWGAVGVVDGPLLVL